MALRVQHNIHHDGIFDMCLDALIYSVWEILGNPNKGCAASAKSRPGKNHKI